MTNTSSVDINEYHTICESDKDPLLLESNDPDTNGMIDLFNTE